MQIRDIPLIKQASDLLEKVYDVAAQSAQQISVKIKQTEFYQKTQIKVEKSFGNLRAKSKTLNNTVKVLESSAGLKKILQTSAVSNLLYYGGVNLAFEWIIRPVMIEGTRYDTQISYAKNGVMAAAFGYMLVSNSLNYKSTIMVVQPHQSHKDIEKHNCHEEELIKQRANYSDVAYQVTNILYGKAFIASSKVLDVVINSCLVDYISQLTFPNYNFGTTAVFLLKYSGNAIECFAYGSQWLTTKYTTRGICADHARDYINDNKVVVFFAGATYKFLSFSVDFLIEKITGVDSWFLKDATASYLYEFLILSAMLNEVTFSNRPALIDFFSVPRAKTTEYIVHTYRRIMGKEIRVEDENVIDKATIFSKNVYDKAVKMRDEVAILIQNLKGIKQESNEQKETLEKTYEIVDAKQVKEIQLAEQKNKVKQSKKLDFVSKLNKMLDLSVTDYFITTPMASIFIELHQEVFRELLNEIKQYYNLVKLSPKKEINDTWIENQIIKIFHVPDFLDRKDINMLIKLVDQQEWVNTKILLDNIVDKVMADKSLKDEYVLVETDAQRLERKKLEAGNTLLRLSSENEDPHPIVVQLEDNREVKEKVVVTNSNNLINKTLPPVAISEPEIHLESFLDESKQVNTEVVDLDKFPLCKELNEHGLWSDKPIDLEKYYLETYESKRLNNN